MKPHDPAVSGIGDASSRPRPPGFPAPARSQARRNPAGAPDPLVIHANLILPIDVVHVPVQGRGGPTIARKRDQPEEIVAKLRPRFCSAKACR